MNLKVKFFVSTLLLTAITLIYWIENYYTDLLKLFIVVCLYFLFVYLLSLYASNIISIIIKMHNNEYSLLSISSQIKATINYMPFAILSLYSMSLVFLFFGQIHFSIYLILIDSYLLFMINEGNKKIVFMQEHKLVNLEGVVINTTKLELKEVKKLGFIRQSEVLCNNKFKFYIDEQNIQKLKFFID